MIKTLPRIFQAASKPFWPLGAAKAFASDNEDQSPAHQLDAAALERIKKAADSGDSEAMFRLGRAFEKGLGVDADLLEACKWYQEAAARDHPQAQAAADTLQETVEFKNASHHERNKKPFQIDLAAIKDLPPTLSCEDSHIPLFLEYPSRLYPVKSESGPEIIDSATFLQDIKDQHPKRMFQLAVLYRYRRLAPPSEHVIYNWVIRSANAGYIPAATSAGFLFLDDGYFIKKDLNTARHLFWIAAQAKEPVALRKIWTFHEVAPDFLTIEEYFNCLVAAAEAGEPEAELVLYINLTKFRDSLHYHGDPAKFLDSAARKGYSQAVKLRKKLRRL